MTTSSSLPSLRDRVISTLRAVWIVISQVVTYFISLKGMLGWKEHTILQMHRYRIYMSTASHQNLRLVRLPAHATWNVEKKQQRKIALTAQMMSLQMIDSGEASLANIASKILVQGLFRHDCGC